jgi:hypothetical protein
LAARRCLLDGRDPVIGGQRLAVVGGGRYRRQQAKGQQGNGRKRYGGE